MSTEFQKVFKPTALAIFVSAIVVSLAGCGLIKTKDRNVEQVSQIKKAAVVAITVDLPARRGVGVDLSSGKVGGASGGSMIAKPSPTAEKMLSAIAERFTQKMSWKMVPAATFTNSAAYVQAYKSTMDGWQNKMPPPPDTNRFLATGVMDADGLRILADDGRQKLMDSLGVDAIVMARVSTSLQGTTVMGIGNRHPKTTVYFEIYKRGIDKPVWFESLDGREMDSVGKTAITIDETKVAELGYESLLDGLSKLQ